MNQHTLTKTSVLLALALAGGAAQGAAADKELLDVLLKNGAITKSQYDSMAAKEGLFSNELVDILAKNGTITKDQQASLSKKAPPAAAPVATLKTPSDGTHITFGKTGGLEIVSNVKEKDANGNDIMDKEIKGADGKPVKEFSLKLGGRIQADSQINWNDDGPYGTDLANGVGFRRARIYLDGVMFRDYEYRFEYDFARNNGGSQGITDAYLRYIAIPHFAITVGQLNEGKSLESTMSNNYLTFIERSLPNNALIEQGPNSKYQLGITAETWNSVKLDQGWSEMPYTVRGGLTTESVGAPGPGNSSANSQGTTNLPGGNNANATNINRNAFSGDTSYQLVGRGTFAPWYKKDEGVLHTGVWGSWRSVNNNYNADGTLRTGGWAYQSQPDTPVDRTNWINTGNLTHGVKGTKGWQQVDNIGMFGAELAGAYGPAHFSAEYMQAQIAGTGYDSSDLLEGFSVAGGYFLTGENRPYDVKKGVWDRVIPKNSFIGGSGWGAWEIAARYDLMDMNTKHINAGSLDIGTLALNWYLTPRIRFMTNWVHVFATNNGSAYNALTPNPATACSPKSSTGQAFQQSGNAAIGCFNGLSPDIWEMAVRFDY